MNFSLTSQALLQLESYQKTLKTLIQVLKVIHEKNLKSQQRLHNSNNSPTVSPAPEKGVTQEKGSILEVPLGLGGAFVVDLSVTEPGFGVTEGEGAGAGARGARWSTSQAYPLSFLASSLSSSASSSVSSSPTDSTSSSSNSSNGTPLYYIRLPLNPMVYPIQCQLSARRLHAQHVSVLDRILRRLCDASPGAFMVGYSDGISGVDPGKEVVYSGENSAIHLQNQQQHHHLHLQQPHHHNSLEHSIAQSRDHGNMDIDSRVAGLVSHVEHPITQQQLPSPSLKPLKDTKVVAEEDVKEVVSSLDITMVSTTTAIMTRNDPLEPTALNEKFMEAERFIACHDYGMMDDIEQLLDVHGNMDLDDLHDMLYGAEK